MPKHPRDQNVVGLHDANHGFTIVSFPPAHKTKSKTAHVGHNQWRTADGGIDGGRCCRHRPLSSFIDCVFDGGGVPSSSDGGRVATVLLLVFICCHRVVVCLLIQRMTKTVKMTTRRTTTMTTMTRRTTMTRKTMMMTSIMHHLVKKQ